MRLGICQSLAVVRDGQRTWFWPTTSRVETGMILSNMIARLTIKFLHTLRAISRLKIIDATINGLFDGKPRNSMG